MADSKDKLDAGNSDQTPSDPMADDAQNLSAARGGDEAQGEADDAAAKPLSAESKTSEDNNENEAELDAKLLEAAQRWAEEFNPQLSSGDDAESAAFVLEEGSRELQKSQDKARRKKAKLKDATRPGRAPVETTFVDFGSPEARDADDASDDASDPLAPARAVEFSTDQEGMAGSEPSIEADQATSSAVDELLAYGDRLADRVQQHEDEAEPSAFASGAGDEDTGEAARDEATVKSRGRSKAKEREREKEKEKEPKAKKGVIHHARAGASLASEHFEGENAEKGPAASSFFANDGAAIEAEIVTDDKQGLMRWDEAINLEAQVEAILFAAPKPIAISEIAQTLADDDGNEPDHDTIEAIVQQLLRLYKERNGGFRLEYDRGAGYQFRTVPAAAPIMERMFSSRQRPLSRAAHETLAIIAYRQPCTRADIEFIRGVDAGSIIKNLLERELVACVGRKEDAGRPMLFGTTAEFMRVFRIQTLNDLPPLSAFQPASEAIIDAFQKIERPDLDIDVEDFIGDDSRQQPEISGELSSDFAKSGGVFEVRGDGSEATAAAAGKVRRVGGIFDNEGFPSDGHENTEVAFPVGDSLAEGSGEDASRGSHQHQRQGGAGAGDEDPT